MDEKAEEFK